MGKKKLLDWTARSIMSTGTERVSLLKKDARMKANEESTCSGPGTDLEHGEAEVVAFPSLVGSTIDAVLYPLQPKFGGMVIDIVSRDIQTPQQQAEALEAVKNTIIAIFLIVVTGIVGTFLWVQAYFKDLEGRQKEVHNNSRTIIKRRLNISTLMYSS